ncbi:Uncharacterized small protein (DUF2158) [Beggiatoa alba B18LD]|uniref:Uncharacterized small protein (DUF2158) n=1 Tax=Beggiatoa alba B18LD TaxID=395493 RepID=I3CKQ1_9GAMM|nr:DUF2158 domain-containing protein [Beggiatoa alba]EIJ44194.1 Uncharacterized small protein (DUF2158) [Beggiatoa alba B18LD]
MSEQFKIGEVVALKSGSPRMTITELNEKLAKCLWMSENQIYYNVFPLIALEKDYDPPIVGEIMG